MSRRKAAIPNDLVVEPRRPRNSGAATSSAPHVSGASLRRTYFIVAAIQGVALGLLGPVVVLALTGESRTMVWMGLLACGIVAGVAASGIAALLGRSYRSRRRREVLNSRSR